MSLHARARKQRIRDFERIYSRSSLTVEHWKLWQVHEPPIKIREDEMVDFWGFNGRDVILITLHNASPYIKEIKTRPRKPLRIFVGMPYEKIDEETVNKMVKELDSGKVSKQKK